MSDEIQDVGIEGINPSEMQNQEFTIGSREFRIQKLSAMRGYDLFQKHIRPCLAAFKGVTIDSPVAYMEIYGSMPYEHLSQITAAFRRYCIMCKNDAGQWVKMATDPEFFMDGMEPAELAFLDLRCFAVNFGQSASVFVREIQAITGVDVSQFIPSQQTPSSGLESTPTTSPSQI